MQDDLCRAEFDSSFDAMICSEALRLIICCHSERLIASFYFISMFVGDKNAESSRTRISSCSSVSIDD
jgi:hypothetical protein